MPALPPVAGVILVQHTYVLGEDTAVMNRYHLAYTAGPPSSGAMTTLASDLAGAWNTHMAPVSQAGLALTSIECTDLSSSSGDQGVWSGSHAGTVTGVTTFASGSFIVKRRSDRRFRGGHSKVYLPGISPAYLNDDQTWDSTHAATVTAAWQAYEQAKVGTAYGGATLVGSVSVSYYEGFTNFTYPSGRIRPIPKLRTGGPLIDSISSWSYNLKVGSQRRRNKQSL